MSTSLYQLLGHAEWVAIREAVGAPPMPELSTTAKVSLAKKPKAKVSLAKRRITLDAS